MKRIKCSKVFFQFVVLHWSIFISVDTNKGGAFSKLVPIKSGASTESHSLYHPFILTIRIEDILPQYRGDKFNETRQSAKLIR